MYPDALPPSVTLEYPDSPARPAATSRGPRWTMPIRHGMTRCAPSGSTSPTSARVWPRCWAPPSSSGPWVPTRSRPSCWSAGTGVRRGRAGAGWCWCTPSRSRPSSPV